jgi:hypothetical protein
MRAIGLTIASTDKAFTVKWCLLTIKRSLISTQVSLRMDFIMVRELWSTGMVMNTMVNGLLVRRRVQGIISGRMGTIMMGIGRRTLQRVQALLVSVVCFTTVSSIWV